MYIIFYVAFALESFEVNIPNIEKVQNDVLILLIMRMLIFDKLINQLIPKLIFVLGVYAVLIRIIIE